MSQVIGFADGITSIEWIDGVLRVDPQSEQARIEAVFAEPVEAWQSVVQADVDGAPTGIAEQIELLQPGSPEHAARAILSLPGGFLIEGDEFIPADDDETA